MRASARRCRFEQQASALNAQRHMAALDETQASRRPATSRLLSTRSSHRTTRYRGLKARDVWAHAFARGPKPSRITPKSACFQESAKDPRVAHLQGKRLHPRLVQY